MKAIQKIVFVSLFFVLLLPMLPADEVSAVWARAYRNAVNLEHRYAIMERIVDQDNREFIPLLDEALRDLVMMWEDLPSETDRAVHRRLVNLVTGELGRLKASQSAPVVYRVMAERDNAFQESIAITALAEMGARDYADRIAMRLKTLNMGAVEYTSREEIETVAASCVYALERLGQPEGYEPVFFASMAGYSAPVMKKIDRALGTMMDDPTDILKSILIEYTDPDIKIRALEEAARSKADPEKKIAVAAEALNQGLTINVESNRMAFALSRLRTGAAAMIRDTGIDSIDVSALLRIMLTRMFELNEILTCLEALGTQKNDMAAKTLADFLQYHNQRPSDLRSEDDYRIVTATIQAMGNTGNALVIPQLAEVGFRDWNRPVRKAAEEALAKLGQ